MTREEMKKLLESPVPKAWVNGETIQFAWDKDWKNVDYLDVIDLKNFPEKFRIKPKPREFWIVRDSSSIISRTCSSKSEAERTLLSLMDQQRCEVVHVREVLE